MCKLLDPSDLEQIVTEEMRRRVPRIVPAALERAAHLGRRGKRLLSPIDPETLGWLYQRQRRALARQPSLLARLRRALGQRGA